MYQLDPPVTVRVQGVEKHHRIAIAFRIFPYIKSRQGNVAGPNGVRFQKIISAERCNCFFWFQVARFAVYDQPVKFGFAFVVFTDKDNYIAIYS